MRHFGGLLVLKVKVDLARPLPWASGQSSASSGSFCLGKSFVNKLPSSLGTCTISYASYSTMFGVVSEVNGQVLPS